jgi:lipopolysaccharide/colanic/teichoic acid biosynthesis glycosyltransferase
MKRAFDIFASIFGIIVFSPILILLILVIAVSSGLPVFFFQVRVGRGGRDFRLAKFRTMAVFRGAEMGTFDAGDSRRVNEVGRILRKAKLDELPQLWNVLKGDMSLVGPRPEVRKWVDAYSVRWSRVLAVRPGITDPASIMFRDEEELLASSSDPETMYRVEILPKKLDYYEAYVNSHTFWGDIVLILKTLRVVVIGNRRSKVLK